MAKVKITWDQEPFKKLKKDFPILLKEIGQQVVAILRDRIMNKQIDIDGKTLWEPHVDAAGESYQGIKYRKYPRPGKTGLANPPADTKLRPLTRGNTKILVDKGHLMRGIKSYVQGKSTLIIESQEEYSDFLQKGTENMPARPFMPKDDEPILPFWLEAEIDKLLDELIEKEINKP
jgi:phage gpG-like protein